MAGLVILLVAEEAGTLGACEQKHFGEGVLGVGGLELLVVDLVEDVELAAPGGDATGLRRPQSPEIDVTNPFGLQASRENAFGEAGLARRRRIAEVDQERDARVLQDADDARQ